MDMSYTNNNNIVDLVLFLAIAVHETCLKVVVHILFILLLVLNKIIYAKPSKIEQGNCCLVEWLDKKNGVT